MQLGIFHSYQLYLRWSVWVSFLLLHCSSFVFLKVFSAQSDCQTEGVRHALTCTGMCQRVPACPDLFLYYPDSLFDSLVFAFAISLCQAAEKLQIRQHLIFIYLPSIPPFTSHSAHPFWLDTHMCVRCNRAAKGHAWPICSPFN